jgi:hypothetical protein
MYPTSHLPPTLCRTGTYTQRQYVHRPKCEELGRCFTLNICYEYRHDTGADGIYRQREVPDGLSVLVVLQQPEAGLKAWTWLDLGFQRG